MSADGLFTLDSNILIYAADGNEAMRQASSLALLADAAGTACVLTPQALAEFYHVVTRKRMLSPGPAAAQMRDWMVAYRLVPGPTAKSLARAAEAHRSGRFQFFDALLLASADEAGCTALISEDMRDGARLGGVRVVAAFDAAGAISAAARALLAMSRGVIAC